MTTYTMDYPPGADLRDVSRALGLAANAQGVTLETAPVFLTDTNQVRFAGTLTPAQEAALLAAVAATTADPNAPWRVLDTLQTRALAALDTNAAFLAIGAPTNAQLTAQARALTRQSSGIIRQLLNRLDSTDGT